MYYSPLRYPGGKAKIHPFISSLIDAYGHVGGTYVEPFAGGAGIPLALLFEEKISTVVLNDLDKGVYSFWKSILDDPERFISAIKTTEVTPKEWSRQRDIRKQVTDCCFELGFATFFLNRTNRSGILSAGMIGGNTQSGAWKIDSRYNKSSLISKIQAISSMRDKIHTYNSDIEEFLRDILPQYGSDVLMYLDPPYFSKGKDLYPQFFKLEDHIRLEHAMRSVVCDWVMTYDDVPEIESLYRNYCVKRFRINYSIVKQRKATELMIFKHQNMVPAPDDIRGICLV